MLIVRKGPTSHLPLHYRQTTTDTIEIPPTEILDRILTTLDQINVYGAADVGPSTQVWRSYKEGFSGLNTSLVRKVGRELSPRGYGRILASKEVLRCTWLLLL